ncbi:uncharacterized protein PRCAT00000231001 [Priceomyces carsonii]|uniref:uncharacterized protein n=1 Tax=Priceomyces carsonii TaxID=28549 RepID=UPI002EDB8168|nr:unnamed protein product [Priceomyces carsonii]
MFNTGPKKLANSPKHLRDEVATRDDASNLQSRDTELLYGNAILLEKQNTLKKFMETDDIEFSNDFDLDEEIDLSYSKFSHLSGISFQNNPLNDNRVLDSPFAQRIKSKLNIELEQENIESIDVTNEGANSRESLAPINEATKSKKKTHIDERINPALKPFGNSYQNIGAFAPQENYQSPSNYKKTHTKKHNMESLSYFKNNQIDPMEYAIPNLQTPGRFSHQRVSPVKVSLTPAQRLEPKVDFKLSNALENFQFSSLIGRGAFANVYKGVNLKTHKVVAIKQILLDDSQDVRGLMGEIDLLKILRHPNIVKYHGFVKTSTSLNVFLEFCSKGSLRQLYKRMGHGLPESQIIKYVRLILEGLNYLHEQGVVHRDVKAANVLITETDEIKLADFGVAAQVSSKHESVVGTPNWMAPETVLGGEGLCTASDIWSLGATVIELFTTNPPYHDLNPMATLHAIGIDDHPPLPTGMTSLALDFLTECFQKQPKLRTTAKLLLQHRWLTCNRKPVRQTSKINSLNESYTPVKPIELYAEIREDANWENDFKEVNKENWKSLGADMIKLENIEESMFTSKETKTEYGRNELLNKFSESNEDVSFESLPRISNQSANDSIQKKLINQIEEEDPFLNIENENFDTNELEIQSKMEFLVTKMSSRVDLFHSRPDEVATSLLKVTTRMRHLVKKYSILHSILIREHGILTLLELASCAPEMPRLQELWFNTLAILNIIFDSSLSQFENFCLLGGIPVFTHFRNISYDLKIRLEVIKFIGKMESSERALSMFVSSGGLRVLSKFVEEDFDSTPEFPLVAIGCIHGVLSKDITRSKSDLCRILSKYGVLFWFVVLLNRLCKLQGHSFRSHSKEEIEKAGDQIIDIIKYFSMSEAKVRINISSADLFKVLIKVYSNIEFRHQLVILKFIRSMSCISDVLNALHSADILEFLIRLLESYSAKTPHYKEVMNLVCPIIYNICYLNHARETELVNLGAVPYLNSLSKINLEFRQFVLPILCELVYCDGVRNILKKNDVLSIYFNLLVDPYWQSNALDAIITWGKHDPDYVNFNTRKACDCLVGGFMLSKTSNLESALDSYFKLLSTNEQLCSTMLKESLIQNILLKLNINNNYPAVQLGLLRILRLLTIYGEKSGIISSLNITTNITSELRSLKAKSVLVEELAIDIISHL